MRLVHVIPSYWPAIRYGGTITSSRALAAAQANHGDDVRVITTNADGSCDLSVESNCWHNVDCASVYYAKWQFPKRLYYSPPMRSMIRQSLKDNSVCHIHSVFLWPTWIASRLAFAAHVPSVISPRGMLVPQLIQSRGEWRKRAWIAMIERKNIARSCIVHATSERERQGLVQMGFDRHATIRVVPNGVAVPQVMPTGSDRQSHRLIFVGRLSWKKRVDWAIHALHNVEHSTLEIVGLDEDGLWPQLFRLATDLGVADRVQYLGELNGVAVQQKLQSAGVLLMPSVDENFGNVVAEAMAQGCPVVVTPGVGASEILQAADAGMVSEDSLESFVASVREFLSDKQAQLASGERGFRFVQANLSWAKIALRMRDLYAEAVEINECRLRA